MKTKLFKLSLIFVVLVLLSMVLISCDAQTYKRRLEKKEYSVYYYNNETMTNVSTVKEQVEKAGINEKDIEWVIVGFKGSQAQTCIYVYHFSDKKYAKKFAEYIIDEIKLEEETMNWSVVYSDKNSEKKEVFIGTEQGINDVRN